MKKLLAVFAAAVCVSASVYAEDLTIKSCKEKVEFFGDMLSKEGKAGIEKMRAPDSGAVFAEGQGYVWIHTLDSVMILHPKANLEGRSLIDMRDINGTYIFVAFNECVEKFGSGWVPYVWPKTGSTESSPKVSYVKMVNVDGEDLVLGCGMYDVSGDDIKAVYPDDQIYTL